MKKIFLLFITVILTFVVGFACSGADNDVTYNIQYHDGKEVKTIAVKNGDLYNLTTIPQKAGYDFIGLYSEVEGGIQYVDELGCSVSAFADKQNITLYACYEPKTYTVVFDYQGAEVNGARSASVKYGNEITSVPTSLSLTNKEFAGWYTQPNCGGTQVADKYGILPTTKVLTEKNYTIPTQDEFVYLYAGFKTVQHTLSLYFGSAYYPEEILVDHGMDIRDIVTTTRINKNAVLSWSQRENDTEKQYIFSGKVTQDMTLYACEYAPVIDYDTKGGQIIAPLVAKAGEQIFLPTPVRENYKFIEWRNEDGNAVDISVMPSTSLKLTAFWHAKLIFDENTGTEVQDITKESGSSIILPTPSKEGYVFAGWYDEEGEKFEKKIMPQESVFLQAGWYVEKKTVIHKKTAEEVYQIIYDDFTLDSDFTLDMSSVLAEDFEGRVQIKAYFTTRNELATNTNPLSLYFNFYSQNILSDLYLMSSKTFKITTYNKYAPQEYDLSVDLVGNKIYCGIQTPPNGRWTRISDYYFELTYPEQSSLIFEFDE